MPDRNPEPAQLRQAHDVALDLVDQLYAGLLRRPPDANGRADYAGRLSSRTSVSHLLTA